jgi:hypothetical protein
MSVKTRLNLDILPRPARVTRDAGLPVAAAGLLN